MDLLETDGQFLSFPDLKSKFSLPKTSFLHYYQVVSAIPNFLFKRSKELILSWKSFQKIWGWSLNLQFPRGARICRIWSNYCILKTQSIFQSWKSGSPHSSAFRVSFSKTVQGYRPLLADLYAWSRTECSLLLPPYCLFAIALANGTVTKEVTHL